MPIEFTLNGKRQSVDVVAQMPLLWVLRDTLGLTGTKFGCGMALCGACTVHINGQPTRSCTLPISMIAGKSVTTIEGLSADNSHPIQKAWIEVDVPQCGYCQSGQIMSAAALLAKKANPTDADIDEAMRGNICRCGTYQEIREAIHRAAEHRTASHAVEPVLQASIDARAAASAGPTRSASATARSLKEWRSDQTGGAQ
jgi:isoquinoline 1-oxidoreductase subunit alpha